MVTEMCLMLTVPLADSQLLHKLLGWCHLIALLHPHAILGSRGTNLTPESRGSVRGAMLLKHCVPSASHVRCETAGQGSGVSSPPALPDCYAFADACLQLFCPVALMAMLKYPTLAVSSLQEQLQITHWALKA